MRNRELTLAMLILLWSLSTACKTETEREPKAGPNTQPRSPVVSDGSIHLTPEQVQANGRQTETVLIQKLAPTLAAIGRVVARAGGEAQIFSPFAGRLVADPARLPHVGSAVSKSQVLAVIGALLSFADYTVTARFSFARRSWIVLGNFMKEGRSLSNKCRPRSSN